MRLVVRKFVIFLRRRWPRQFSIISTTKTSSIPRRKIAFWMIMPVISSVSKSFVILLLHPIPTPPIYQNPSHLCPLLLARQHQRYKQIDISMSSREKHGRDDFQLPHKNRIKILKREMKAALRSSRPPQRALNESPQNSDDDEYHCKLVNRGAEWWGKVNYRFFRRLAPTELQAIMERTTSEELLALRHPAPELDSYYEEEFVKDNPFLGSASLLRVLFRREVKLDMWEKYELVSFTFKEYISPRQLVGRTVENGLHLSSFRLPKRECPPIDFSHLQLDIVDAEQDQHQIQRLLAHDVIVSQHKQQLDVEIALWEAELQRINQESIKNWQAMLGRMEGQGKEFDQEEVEAVRRELRMTEVLVCFKRGHSDKTEQMLEDALQVAMIKEISMQEQDKPKRNTHLQKMKCLFETDCKICFCTESDDKNPVLYCDSCNASFHQSCYGLQSILQEEKFHCEECLFLHKNQSRQGEKIKLKKPGCQICCKINFPMRMLEGHFYHVTCLVLFDLVEIKNYRIEFKNELSHPSIVSMVVQNEAASGLCAFCLKQTGMKFPCGMGCGEWFHPICAYLNGVQFELTRGYRVLNSRLTCPKHYPNRNALNQIYLRRFFCDYRGTADMTDLQFQEEYKKEVQEKAAILQGKRRDAAKGVKGSGKMFKNFKCNQSRLPRLKKEKSQLALSGSKKDSQEAPSNPLPPNSQTDITETRKLLLKRSERLHE